VSHSFPGHMLSTMIFEGPCLGQNDGAEAQEGERSVVLFLYAFASAEMAQLWHDSKEKADRMEALSPIVDEVIPVGGDGYSLTSRDLHQEWGRVSTGWEGIFQVDPAEPLGNVSAVSGPEVAQMERAESGSQVRLRKPPPAAPPRWKMAVCIYFAVWIVVVLSSLPGSLNSAIDASLSHLPELARIPISIALSGLVGVPAIAFVVLPIIVHVAQPWLHSSPTPRPSRTASKHVKFFYRTCC